MKVLKLIVYFFNEKLTLINKKRIFICYEEIKKTYKNQEKGEIENPPYAYKSA